jgi:hypothetical protein
MNTVRITGKVVSPRLKEVSAGRSVLRFALVRPHEPLLRCVAWGGMAQAVARDCPEDTIAFMGLRETQIRGHDGVIKEYLVQEYHVKPQP